MELVMGALTTIISKLGGLLVGQYNLRKEVKGEIRFLQSELESMQCAIELLVSNKPPYELHIQDKIWARDLMELSYDIEDTIDRFMVRGKGTESTELHGIKNFVDRSASLFRKAMFHRNISTKIRGIKNRVEEVSKRRDRYKISNDVVNKPVSVDPYLIARYQKATDLVGIDEAREELIQILMEENEVSNKEQDKIVSIVGFGGLGKTTLGNAVYERLKDRFDCSAFVSVSQTPCKEKLFSNMLYQVTREKNPRTNIFEVLIEDIRKFLEKKRYFIVIDDIWDISFWKMIKCALPDNNVGTKIITTTRILRVAEHAGGAYKLKPLSLNNSRKLLFQRIFRNEKYNSENTDTCPIDELAQVSDKILKKCAGVPLAIITMASLLAYKARNEMEWYEVYNSIGTSLESNFDVENMRKILSFSYFHMPSHLRNCLLYLSMFPEDHKIHKNRLIWMWIAEGFIQPEKQGEGLFELGQSYFDELINRSMIQPIYDRYTGMTKKCRVHDMVLDLIRSLSSQENFVIAHHTDCTSQTNMIRRLSLQNGKENNAMTQSTMRLEQVRSVIVFPSAVNMIPALGSFRVLRVLNLEGCDLSQGYSLKDLRNLFHLRYLGLNYTGITELPKEIGNMQFLQTLGTARNKISSLPSTAIRLGNLMCLYIDHTTRVPNGIGNLRCLQELLILRIDDSNNDIIEELGKLTELRVLSIFLSKWSDKLAGCLCKLQKIQRLYIRSDFDQRNIGGLDSWVPSRHLRALGTGQSCWFSKLPSWMNPGLLPHLSSVSIAVRELQQEDLDILGRFQALRYLNLEVDNENLGIHGIFIFGSGLFPDLVRCELGFVGSVVFQQGAMPRLTSLWFSSFSMLAEREIDGSSGCLDLGLGNLPLLQEVVVNLRTEGASEEEVEGMKTTLRHAAEMHPNSPTLRNR